MKPFPNDTRVHFLSPRSACRAAGRGAGGGADEKIKRLPQPLGTNSIRTSCGCGVVAKQSSYSESSQNQTLEFLLNLIRKSCEIISGEIIFMLNCFLRGNPSGGGDKLPASCLDTIQVFRCHNLTIQVSDMVISSNQRNG